VKRPSGDNGRLGALRLLASVLDHGRSLAESNNEAVIDPSRVDPRNVAFAKHLAYGVLRWLGALEWLSAQLLRRPLKTRDRDIHRLVLIGLYQLWRDSTEPYAAVHESAQCARQLGKPWAVAVINAVLRRFQRERDSLLERLAEQDDRYAHPPWMLATLRQDWPDDWKSIVTANNQPAPLWLRLRRDLDTSEIKRQLEREGYICDPHAFAPDALRISPATAVSELPGFNDGVISVQDPAAQLAADLLNLAPGQRVLDACSAPGGKTGHALEIEPEISMTALDRAPGRLKLVRQNLARLGLDALPGLVLLDADAAEPGSWWDGKPFQRILLDAPCTASGVIRRHPEIKWLRTPGQLDEAVALQARLLDSLWPLLEPGGILLYATCSVFKDENNRQIEQFLGRHPDAELTEIDAEWGHRPDAGRQILPGEYDMDGFYYARLRKH
jgi:16S rRNA (cytosine967-C5)-methyltransferase